MSEAQALVRNVGTTVGYGDRHPVTSEGRFVGAILMCAGVRLFGTFSGFLAAWFIGPQAASEGTGVLLLEVREVSEEKHVEDVSVSQLTPGSVAST